MDLWFTVLCLRSKAWLAAPVLLAHAEVTANIICFSNGSKTLGTPAVLVFVQQPSSEVFVCFDELLLLQRGGQVLYAGPVGHRASALMACMQDVLHAVRPSVYVNPASWMLDVFDGMRMHCCYQYRRVPKFLPHCVTSAQLL